ncbi:MAG: NAD(P)-binding domain-containing protein, partial [Planctomycetes bacterium]|nr:NAD(P)-binding domain-containing protein [Planctomycetota bacterium]
MDHLLLILAALVTGLVIAALLRRRAEVRAHERSLSERSRAVERGSHRARLQHPSVDLANCIGCGACVRACPEDGVLQLAYGQAVVVHGARCVGHGLCADACPTSAIALTLGDLSSRSDLPAVDQHNEAIGAPGLFLAGEITGFALVRTAVAHGAMVARAVHERLQGGDGVGEDEAGDDVVDLVVVGAGPAGLACLLAAKELGLRAIGLDQAEELGGTVAAYPRKKLVMTQPMELPLHGRLGRLEYTKEQLVELWQELAARHQLDVRLQTTVDRVDPLPPTGAARFEVVAGDRRFRARCVCLSVGRRGTPRRLGVPGEDLDKVAYSLLDAQGYRDRRVLVVGGGDSAVEAALALAEQPGNEVVLSYRREHFSRLKAKNEQRILAAIDDGLVTARLGTVVDEITADAVVLREQRPAAARAP